MGHDVPFDNQSLKTKKERFAMLTRIVKNCGLFDVCFNVESAAALTPVELNLLFWLIATRYKPDETYLRPDYKEGSVVEIGPLPKMETPFWTNAGSICRALALAGVTRIEQSRIYHIAGDEAEAVIAESLDVLTEMIYPHGGLVTFETGQVPEEVEIVDVLGRGEAAVREASDRWGLGMDDFDVRYVTGMFQRYGRNPTNVGVFQTGQGLSNHCRHWDVKGRNIINGVEVDQSMLEMVMEPLRRLAGTEYENVTLKAFNDNGGVIEGSLVPVLVPNNPGHPSYFKIKHVVMHPTATAETHNHPMLIWPYGGSDTLTGGLIRDGNGIGCGSQWGAGAFVLCLANLHNPAYQIPGEVIGGEITDDHAHPLRIYREGKRGALGHGNRCGFPQIMGGFRTFEQYVCGVRTGFRKPVGYGACVGRVWNMHLQKHEPKPGQRIVHSGGPAYEIGVGGGSASSVMLVSITINRKSVQRGNGEMSRKMYNVIRACIERGIKNPIQSEQDQGAGGPSNALTELMDLVGGVVDIRKITVGDKTMSVLCLWSAEYQECYGFLINPEDMEEFRAICRRERVNCEDLGEITGDGHVRVIDSWKNPPATVVDIELKDILGKLPQKTFYDNHLPREFRVPEIPRNLTFAKAVEVTFQQPSVASKSHITEQADRCVTGRVVGKGQQHQGLAQIAIGDVGVLADSFLPSSETGLYTGSCSSLGESPLHMLIDPKAGARLGLAEMLTNMMPAGGIELARIRCRVNCMAAANVPGQRAMLIDAYLATRDALIDFWMACDGGKDSLSMKVMVNGELVVSPIELIIFGYARMPDITRIITPDVKLPGESRLGLIEVGTNEIGGSALLQALNQLGNKVPDCLPAWLKSAWKAKQRLHERNKLLAMHDISAGGRTATVAEMCMASFCGLELDNPPEILNYFGEGPGVVVEYLPQDESEIQRTLEEEKAPQMIRLGKTTNHKDPHVFDIPLTTLRQWWERTSFELKRLDMKNGTAEEEFAGLATIQRPVYDLSFVPTINIITESDHRPPVGVVYDEGVNSEREFTESAHLAGLNPKDVHMEDLLSGEQESLDEFQGLIFPGGFSYMDVFGSARGWAAVIKFNKRIWAMFERVFNDPGRFVLGVCNGAQLMPYLGLLPFRGLSETSQPYFVENTSGVFASRWIQGKILPNDCVLLDEMEGSTLGVYVAHGEGRAYFPDPKVLQQTLDQGRVPIVYVGPDNEPARGRFPWNPNGSQNDVAAFSTKNCLAMMPHGPDRGFLPWQHGYWPSKWSDIKVSPWLKILQNARAHCLRNR